jgi:CPA2 family monovalent cation:H+ antiporter-2
MGHGGLLLQAGLLLGAIALSGIIFQRLHLSAIPAFILLGLGLREIVGQSALVESFASFGVVLLLFFVGLEFSISTLLTGRRLIVHGLRDFVLCFPVGFVVGLLLGFGVLGAALIAGAFYISSSAIIAKSLIELRRTANPETESVLGILVFEDLAIAVFLALVSGIALSGGNLGAGLLGAGKGILFFSVAVVVARAGRPLLNRLLDTEADDLFILLMAGVVLLLSWAAQASGLSEAIGAFLAGALVAETAHKQRTEVLFAPLQGLFAAVFFVSFGLSVDVRTLPDVLPEALLLTFLAVITKLAAGWWTGQADGLSKRASLSLGLTLVPRGEFSIVIAGIAAQTSASRAAPLITLMVLVLAIAGTLGILHAPTLSQWIFPRRAERSLEERGFNPALAMDDFPPTTETASSVAAGREGGPPTP